MATTRATRRSASRVGGNPNLLPETRSKTLGFVYSPSWLEGFDVSLDWWQHRDGRHDHHHGGQDIVDGCVRDNRPELCALFTRNPGGDEPDLLVTTTKAA